MDLLANGLDDRLVYPAFLYSFDRIVVQVFKDRVAFRHGFVAFGIFLGYAIIRTLRVMAKCIPDFKHRAVGSREFENFQRFLCINSFGHVGADPHPCAFQVCAAVKVFPCNDRADIFKPVVRQSIRFADIDRWLGEPKIFVVACGFSHVKKCQSRSIFLRGSLC